MGNLLSREQIAAAKRRTVDVECPELGGTIRLQELSIGEMKAIDKTVAQQLSMMIVDENNKTIFADDDGIALLDSLSASVSMRLISAAATLNGISKEAIDSALKNLQTSQTKDSASA